MKIWVSNESADDKIIAFFNQTLYKANPKTNEVEDYISKLNSKVIPTEKGIEIPINYLKEIIMEEGKNYLEVQFGADSTEHFKVSYEPRKKEIFNYLKANLPAESIITNYSKIKSARKPLIAMVVVSILFTWTLYFAINIENGYDYEISGSYSSVTGIVLALAYLGTTKICLIFGSLLLISLIAFFKKYKAPLTLHRLIINR